MRIHEWIAESTEQLKTAGIKTARLDAELILSHTLRRPRTFIHSHPSDAIEQRLIEVADARLRLRIERTPLAYIIGHKEFYGRRFKVTTATMVPRPETETIIEILNKIIPKAPVLTDARIKLIDVGTGSGCIGITAKLEHPILDVTLIDVSQHALAIAQQNATLLGADVTVMKSDLLQNYPLTTDVIVANLPYVDPSWEVSKEVHAEPMGAIYASDGGLMLINKLLVQAKSRLNQNGYLILESDSRQHDAIIERATSLGYTHISTVGLITVFRASA